METGWEAVERFEKAISEYTGAPYVTCTNGCTSAIRLALKWINYKRGSIKIEIPCHTYPSVPQMIKNTGHSVIYTKELDDGFIICGLYQLWSTEIRDCARWFSKEMYTGIYPIMCVSFHPEKPFGLECGGGAILHDNLDADQFYKEIRFHARKQGVPTNQDTYRYWQYADDCRMWPATAQAGIQKLAIYSKTDHPPMLEGIDDYPDCSKLFGGNT